MISSYSRLDKVVDKIRTTGNKKPHHCARKDCSKATSEQKPFCPDHLEDNPYIKILQGEINRRNNEVSRVKRNGWEEVDINSTISREILGNLEVNGPKAYSQLQREICELTSIELTTSYAMALSEAGLAHLELNVIGTKILALGPK